MIIILLHKLDVPAFMMCTKLAALSSLTRTSSALHSSVCTHALCGSNLSSFNDGNPLYLSVYVCIYVGMHACLSICTLVPSICLYRCVRADFTVYTTLCPTLPPGRPAATTHIPYTLQPPAKPSWLPAPRPHHPPLCRFRSVASDHLTLPSPA